MEDEYIQPMTERHDCSNGSRVALKVSLMSATGSAVASNDDRDSMPLVKLVLRRGRRLEAAPAGARLG